MRHRNYGRKLSRNTEHRRSLLRNLVTSLILSPHGYIKTTVAKAKAARGVAEEMITLGKHGDLHSRRLASAYLLTPAAVEKLFGEVAKRFTDRQGGYTRIVRTGWRKGDGADTAQLELIGISTEGRQKLAEARGKRAEARRKAAEEAAAQQKAPPPDEEDKK